MDNYTLPAALVAKIINILNELPARVSREPLNELETLLVAQQAEANKKETPA